MFRPSLYKGQGEIYSRRKSILCRPGEWEQCVEIANKQNVAKTFLNVIVMGIVQVKFYACKERSTGVVIIASDCLQNT